MLVLRNLSPNVASAYYNTDRTAHDSFKPSLRDENSKGASHCIEETNMRLRSGTREPGETGTTIEQAAPQPRRRPRPRRKEPKAPRPGSEYEFISQSETPWLLPPMRGPGLLPFPFRSPNSIIKWGRRLGLDSDQDEDAPAGQGYVFHAEIDGKDYAVKLVRFNFYFNVSVRQRCASMAKSVSVSSPTY